MNRQPLYMPVYEDRKRHLSIVKQVSLANIFCMLGYKQFAL